MADIKVTLDTSALTQYLSEFAKEISGDLQKSVKVLAMATHVHILDEAKKKLNKYDLPIYEESLSEAVQLDTYLWEITLVDRGVDIENGREPRDMKPGLLKDGKTGTDKDGKTFKYRIIPMPQGKTASKDSSFQRFKQAEETIGQIKTFLKTQKNPKLSYSGIEMHTITDPVTGSPRKVPRMSEIGPNGHPKPLHVFDIPSKIPGKGNTEQLARLHIYQIANKNGNAKKVMTTFRTVTDKDDQKDKWIFPAREAANIFKETESWVMNKWETDVLPALLDKYRK